MTAEQIAVVEACSRAARSGELNFPQIVARLIEIGVERYHVDYSRSEVTYYLPSGDSHIVAAPHAAQPIADAFSAESVAAAVRQSQQGEHSYADFVRKTMNAGCIGYFAQLAGRRVQYFGRRGDCHTELFPDAE